MSKSTRPLEDIIDEIMLEEDRPTHEALERWIGRHAEHRDELRRFFSTWALQETATDKVAVDEERAGDRMLSKALDFLSTQKAVAVSPAAAPQRLHQVIKACGLTDQEFGAKCDLEDEALVDKLDLRRLLRVPREFYERAAAALGTTIEVMRVLCSGEPVGAGANKSKGKPKITTEDFLAAVEASDLSDPAKARWAAIVARDPETEAGQ